MGAEQCQPDGVIAKAAARHEHALALRLGGHDPVIHRPIGIPRSPLAGGKNVERDGAVYGATMSRRMDTMELELAALPRSEL